MSTAAGPNYPMRMDPRQDLICTAQAAAQSLGRQTLTRAEFTRQTGISGNQIYQHFDGWRDLCNQAGLDPHMQNVRLGNDEVFGAMRDTFNRLGGIATRTKFAKHFPYAVSILKHRGLTWSAALGALREWVQRNDPAFPYLSDLPESPARTNRVCESEGDRRNGVSWQPKGGRVFGDLLNFRGLLHAPVNEQGVVFLFGMVARELGYVVESVTCGFPDCEAKRQVGKGRWERVRIEFEYQSRNYRDHGHDLSGCDVLVCWEHNWPECPMETLELRSALTGLTQ